MIDQYQVVSIAAMFMIGLMGSGHCVGMCGGIATALGLASRSSKNWQLVVGYNLGRISSYALAGAIVASLGQWGTSVLAFGPQLRVVAGVILVLMGLYLADWWRVLTKLETLGSGLWRKIQPLGNKFLPVKSTAHALVVGAVWGWLPCGLVYTALVYAATSANTIDGALMMAAFGLGTAPAMLAGGMFSGGMKKFLQTGTVRMLMAALMIIFGVWTAVTGFTHMSHMEPSDSAADSSIEHQHHH